MKMPDINVTTAPFWILIVVKETGLSYKKDKLLIDSLAERIKRNYDLRDAFMTLLESTSHEEYLVPTQPMKEIVAMGLFEICHTSDRCVKYKLTTLGKDVRGAFYKK
jgi:hypothetical protein